MGFLNNNNNGNKLSEIFLELTDDPARLRPLAKQPTSLWIHRISPVKVTGPDAQPRQIRKYATEPCVSTGRSGAGCHPCTTPDPLWDKLEEKNKRNKKGQRSDFPKSMTHLLPVLNLTTGKVKIMKGGNQLYEEMDKWFEIQPESGKDLRRCEWQACKTGKDIYTKYSTTRFDATPFVVTPELEAEAAIMMEKAKQEFAPTKLEAFMDMVNGDSDPMAQAATTVSVPVVGVVNQTPPVVSTTTTTPATPAASATVQAGNVLEAFSQWCNQQPEFQGMGAFENLIPVLQEKIGGVNYHVCNPAQLADLKVALTSKLNSIRAKKV